MSLLDMLQQQLGGDAVKQISGQLGADHGTTQTAIAAALPMIVGALARNTQDPAQAGALSNALSKDHDGSILDDVTGYLSRGGNSADGNAILGHVLGDRTDAVATGLSHVSGLDPAKAATLLSMLAPLVMGALGKAQRQGGLDPGALAGMLGGEHQQAMNAAPGVMGMLGKFLDRNNDGSVLDDIGGMLGKTFGR